MAQEWLLLGAVDAIDAETNAGVASQGSVLSVAVLLASLTALTWTAASLLRWLKGTVRRAREARFLESIAEHIPDMVFVKAADSLRFVWVNQAVLELLGLSRGDLLGKTDRDFFPDTQARWFQQSDRRVLSSGTLLEVAEEPIRTRGGGVRLLHTKKIPIVDARGRPLYLLGLSEDVTERTAARDERERLLVSEHAARAEADAARAAAEGAGRRARALLEIRTRRSPGSRCRSFCTT